MMTLLSKRSAADYSDMGLLILSFMAGVLTVAAPCVLPFLPVIVGGAMASGEKRPARQWLAPVVIAISLAVSVVAFTLLIKGTTVLLGVPQMTWQVLSGLIVLLLGISFAVPSLWERVAAGSGLFNRSNQTLAKAFKLHGTAGLVLTGAALGPVFSSCSPTYALIVATVLPVSFAEGTAYLVAYAIGMSATLLLIAYLGQAFAQKLGWLGRADGWFKRVIGVLFILVGLAVMFGIDKSVQSYVLDRGWYEPIGNLERSLRGQ